MRHITLAPSKQFISSLIPMFVICPASFDLVDAEWFDNVYEAKEEALDWSVELAGRNVIVYEAVEEDSGAYEFNKLYAICA
jgi:hypothetical protein